MRLAENFAIPILIYDVQSYRLCMLADHSRCIKHITVLGAITVVALSLGAGTTAMNQL